MKQILSVMLLLLQTAAFSQDLIVTNYAGPTTFSRYEEFAPDITVKNSGIVSINDTFFVAAYLSTDDQWQASDILVNSIYKYELAYRKSIQFDDVKTYEVTTKLGYQVFEDRKCRS
jgi:hypothetical protein